MSDGRLLLGLDVGGTKCAAIIGDDAGAVLDRREWASDAARGPGPMIADLLRHGRELLAAHGDATACGVSIGGPLNVDAGVILSPPNLPGWDAVPLKARLAEALAMPVRVEHDAAACILAEFHWGAARGASPACYLTCGTGFGVGLLVGGVPHYGARGNTCEIGHVRYRDDGPLAFGKRGCFEAFGAGSSLGRIAAWRFPERWPHPPGGPELSALARAGDADAADVLAINARAVGDACALLADLLVPEVIVLGSLAAYLGEPWLAQVRRAYEAEVLPSTAAACRIVPSGLGSRLQDCSALAAATLATPS